jgi:hypothetical protein
MSAHPGKHMMGVSMSRAGNPYQAVTPHPGHVGSPIPQRAEEKFGSEDWNGTDGQKAMYQSHMMNPGGKWISKAIKSPGSLHRQLGIPSGQKIPAKKMAAARSGKHGALAQKRANLAKTLASFHK